MTVAVVGSGPSLATFDLEALRGRRFIAINSSCRRMAQIATAGDILYFTDNAWNENRPELAKNWPGVVISSNRNVKARLGDAVRFIDVTDLSQWMGTRGDYVQASSGHIATCLAFRMGAARVALVAFECGAVGGRTHGHNDYQAHDVGVYPARFLPGWEGLAPVFERRGFDVVNTTPHSAIECFRRADLADVTA